MGLLYVKFAASPVMGVTLTNHCVVANWLILSLASAALYEMEIWQPPPFPKETFPSNLCITSNN